MGQEYVADKNSLFPNVVEIEAYWGPQQMCRIQTICGRILNIEFFMENCKKVLFNYWKQSINDLIFKNCKEVKVVWHSIFNKHLNNLKLWMDVPHLCFSEVFNEQPNFITPLSFKLFPIQSSKFSRKSRSYRNLIKFGTVVAISCEWAMASRGL